MLRQVVGGGNLNDCFCGRTGDRSGECAFGGTVETVTRKLIELQELGAGHVICGFYVGRTGGLDRVKETIRRFATEVIPAVKAAEKPLVAGGSRA